MLVLGHTEFQSSRLWSECTDHWTTSPSPYAVICVLIWMISWPLSEISGRGDLMCVECLCSCPLPSLTAVAWVSKGGNTPCSSLGRQNFLSRTVDFIMKSCVTTYFMAQLTFLLPKSLHLQFLQAMNPVGGGVFGRCEIRKLRICCVMTVEDKYTCPCNKFVTETRITFLLPS